MIIETRRYGEFEKKSRGRQIEVEGPCEENGCWWECRGKRKDKENLKEPNIKGG